MFRGGTAGVSSSLVDVETELRVSVTQPTARTGETSSVDVLGRRSTTGGSVHAGALVRVGTRARARAGSGGVCDGRADHERGESAEIASGTSRVELVVIKVDSIRELFGRVTRRILSSAVDVVTDVRESVTEPVARVGQSAGVQLGGVL